MAKSQKRTTKLRPNRLVKTNGKFSWGKIAIIVVSLVAIGSILVSVSLAGFNTGTITAENPLTRHASKCGVAHDVYGGYIGLLCFQYGIVWWGPYLSYTINAPSGEYVTECALIRKDPVSDTRTVRIRLDMTSNNGAIVWGSRDFDVVNNATRPYCYKFRIPESGTLGGPLRLSQVEFRVWILSGPLGGMYINSVSATT